MPETGATTFSATPSEYSPVEVAYPQKMEMENIMVPSPALFATIDECVEACLPAQKIWAKTPIEQRKVVIENIRRRARETARDLAWAAWSETGRGRFEDKVAKNLLTANKTPGVEDLETAAYSGDCGLTLLERAPFGVIGAVTPVTNPTSTIINNSISILAAGNGVVFNPHPNGKLSTCRAIAMVNAAIVEAGGPSCLITGCSEPTVQGAVDMMKHPKTACSLITGGPAVVKIALTSGKRAICAGPGNPPVVVDETADLSVAAKGIIAGAGFDNNMICIDEKTCICVESVADQLIAELKKEGCYICSPEEVKKLESVIFTDVLKDNGETPINTKMVGQNASVILNEIGVTVSDDVRLAILPVEKEHSLVWSEQLMPCLPLVRVPTFCAAIELARATEHGNKHTCAMYSTNVHNMTKMGKLMDTTIFVQNGPCLGGLGVGGEGFTSFSIAGTTGEGMTRPRTFTRERRCALVDAFHMV